MMPPDARIVSYLPGKLPLGGVKLAQENPYEKNEAWPIDILS